MRILDLGAHDGFVTNWIGRNFVESREQIHCDGVEANSHGVEVANERSRRDGIPGKYVQGLAEDAASHFSEGSYDAVVAFELIEHVPDVDSFLTVCERMCSPVGRVYLSTPDGTFGEGKNPHHLRAYRAIDLFELCRRRGSVSDMLVGSDGVTVISYVPSASGPRDSSDEVAIYCGPGWEKWHPTDIERKGLGGSETAAIRLAAALSEIGYVVTVYGECDFCAYRQVTFKPHQTFDPLEKRKAVIASRAPWLADRKINAEKFLLWMHDTDYGQEMTDERMRKFDKIMVLSNWQRIHVMDKTGMGASKFFVTGNAIEPSYFNGWRSTHFVRGECNCDPADEFCNELGECSQESVVVPTALYSSSPDRGLDLLLKLWPKVREQVPGAELRYCYSSVYDKVAEQNPMVRAFRDEVRKLADQPGVVNLGSLTQPDLANEMLGTSVWLAPSYNSSLDAQFKETYCIGALEAAAAGCAVIASDWGALPERVEDAVNSVLIPPPVEGKGIREDEWVSAIVNCMQHTTPQKSPTALQTTWAMRAAEFDSVIHGGVATF